MKDWKKEFNKKCLQHIDDGGLMKTHETGEYPVLDLKLLENYISNLIAQVEQQHAMELASQKAEIVKMIETKRAKQSYTDCGTYAQEVLDDLLTNLKEISIERINNNE